MIVHSELFIKLISWFMRPSAITLWPFIIVSPSRVIEQAHRENKSSAEVFVKLINHERIHLAQQKELFLIGFYILYVYFYVYFYVKHRSSYAAYRNIPFEQEAYACDFNPEYLNVRSRFAWRRYV